LRCPMSYQCHTYSTVFNQSRAGIVESCGTCVRSSRFCCHLDQLIVRAPRGSGSGRLLVPLSLAVRRRPALGAVWGLGHDSPSAMQEQHPWTPKMSPDTYGRTTHN